MKDITYSKDFRHNYLVITDDRVLSDDYQIKMIVKNDIRQILNCKDRMVNGEGLLYYDVTGKQNFKSVYDNGIIGIEDISCLFRDLGKALDNLAQYILYGSNLILNPEYVFLNIESKEFSFLFYPQDEEENTSFSTLIEFLMDHIDNDDLKATEAVYQVADMVNRQHFSVDEAVEFFLNEFITEEDPVEDECMDQGYIEYEDITEPPEIKEESWWRSFVRRFFAREEEEVFKETEEMLCETDDVEEEASDETVFIPWVENSENKLYGVGKGNKYHIDLTKAPFTVGKLQGVVDIVINDNSISRMHAKFFRQSSKYFMQDMNSTNGTFRNGLRLNPNQQIVIEPGDEIGLGKLKFIYR